MPATRLTEMPKVRFPIMLARSVGVSLAEKRTASTLDIAWFEPF